MNVDECLNQCKRNYDNNPKYNSECEKRFNIYKESGINNITENECFNIIIQINTDEEKEKLKKITDSHDKCYKNCMDIFNNKGFCKKFITQNKNNIITSEKCNEFIQNNIGSLPKISIEEQLRLKQIGNLKRQISEYYQQFKVSPPEKIIRLLSDSSISEELIKELQNELTIIQSKSYKPTISIPSFNKQPFENTINNLLQTLQQKLNEDPLFYQIISMKDKLFLEQHYIQYIDFLKNIIQHFDEYYKNKDLFTTLINSLETLLKENERQIKETERRRQEEIKRIEAERKAREEAERKAITHPPYKPFLQLPIKNFKWRGNLCWVYSYLQYIYRIECINNLILNRTHPYISDLSSSDDKSDDNINIKIDFIDPLFRKYNLTINLKDLFENINNIIQENKTKFTTSESKNIFMAHNTKIADGYKLTEIINHRDKCQGILQLIYDKIYNKILKDNINCYIIISLWFIFNFLNNNNSNINNIYSKINIKYQWFDHDEEKYNIEDFIHIFILIIAYSANKEIYTDGTAQNIHNIFKKIFKCLGLERDDGFYNKFKDQTCFILQGNGHYVNLIKDIDNEYYILDSQYDDKIYYNNYKEIDKPIENIIQNEDYLKQIAIPVSFKYNKITYTYNMYYGGNNYFNKYKLKYNLLN